MSDLQLSLRRHRGRPVIGGVTPSYNWVQERNFRPQRLEQAFGDGPDDVLLPDGCRSATASGEARLEPAACSCRGAPARAATAPQPHRGRSAAAGPRDAPTAAAQLRPDADLDYVAEIEAGAPIAERPARGAARAGSPGAASRCACCGLNAERGAWEEAVRGRGARYRGLASSRCSS